MQVNRTDADSILANHEGRIASLERAPRRYETFATLDTGQPVSVAPGERKAVPTGGADLQFYTNNSRIFEMATVTDSGTDYPAIQMNVPGHYLVQALLLSGGIPDGVGYGVGPFGFTDADESVFYYGPSARMVPTGENAAFAFDPSGVGAQNLVWQNIQSLGDGFVAPPAQFVPACENFDITLTHTISVDLLAVIYYLDDDTTFID